MHAQLKKGVLEICILKILLRGDTYGYPIMHEMRKLFNDTDESTIYSILRRLKKEGFVDCYEQKSTEGPVRKYYKITRPGKKKLEYMCSEFEHLTKILDSL